MSNIEKINNSIMNDGAEKKEKRFGTFKLYSVLSVVVLVAIVFVFNIFIDAILGDKLVFDLSSTGQNSISKVTEDYIDSLPADTHIRIVALMEKPVNINNTSMEYVIPLLDDYQAKSDGKITVEYIDPAKYPSIISELDPQGVYDLQSGMFLVAANGKVQTVAHGDCFAFDQNYLQYYGAYVPVANTVESAFTNAIVNLSRGYSHKAYFITGLQEPSHQQFTGVLAALGVDSEDIPASDSFTIPDDCELLIINGINIDITSQMSAAIQEYLNNGGKLFVAVNYNNAMPESFANLNEALHVMNLNIEDYVIQENDPAYMLDKYGFQSNVSVGSDFSNLTSSNVIRTHYTRPVRKFDLPYSYVMTTPILTTSASATSIQVDDQGYATVYQNAGVYNAGMYSTFDGTSNPPEAYVFGTTDLSSDEYIGSYGTNDANVMLLRGIIKQLLPTENTVEVATKPMSDFSVDSQKVTTSSINIMTIILMVIIPLGLIIVSVVVYNRRKNL